MYMTYQKCIITRISAKILAIPLLGAHNKNIQRSTSSHRVMNVGPVVRGVARFYIQNTI